MSLDARARPTRFAVTITALLVVLSVNCRRGGRAPAPGVYRGAPVILISIDTLRADHLALYGYRSGNTPILDGLGRDGIVFDDLYSHCPLTLPSHSSLLTGLLPLHHGVRDNIGFRLGASGETIADRFRAAGYATGAAVSTYVLRHQTGIARGFDFYDDAIEIAGTGESLSESQRDGRLAVEALAAWIDRQSTARLFAFLHLYEPHTPYDPPPSHRLANPYDGEIAYADELVGRFLARLQSKGLLDQAVVAVVSDHGEGLNDHGESEHGIFLYREALHVPGILRLPRRAGAGTRVGGTIGIVDVAATLLDLAGLSAQNIDGRPLSAALSSGQADDRTVYSESWFARLHFGWADLASAVEGRYHFVRAPRPELFDLSVDPKEQQNVAVSKSSTASGLGAWIDRTTTGSPAVQATQESREARERLQALGYVGSSPAAAASTGALPDPKDGIASYESLKHALTAAAHGDDEGAASELRRIVAAQPRMLDAWEALAKSLERLNRTADAVAAFGKVLEIDPLKPETHLALARMFAIDRQRPRAIEHAKLAAERDPAAAYETLAELSMDAGRRDEAAAFARKSLDADASRYMSHFLLGVIAQQQGRCGDAISSFRSAIDAKRTDPHAVVRNLHAGLADCLARSGRTADAEREFKAELADIPSSPEARVGLATLYRSQGRDAESRDVLGQLVTVTPGADASTYWTVVHTLTVLGDASAAREWSARAHERFPNDSRFR